MRSSIQAEIKHVTTDHVKPQHPLLVVLGATGTGKSQLAVELAKRFNGEVINGDAMQLYAGLPVITNKIKLKEQQGIPHHLLGCIGLNEPPWVVSTFVNRAVGVIDSIRAQGRLPILVGGTHYYTHSLLFRDTLVEAADFNETVDKSVPIEERFPVLGESTETLMAELTKVDPVMAARWHPNDRRKIQRSLMIYLETGKTASQTYEEQQHARQGGNTDGAGSEDSPSTLRYDTLCFWIHTEPSVLQERLNNRVETMLKDGLLDEVRTLHKHAEQELLAGHHVDETKGIWVSIGFKEFRAYQDLLAKNVEDTELFRALSEGVERTKIANRQYAKRQITWIKHKLIVSLSEVGASKDLYLLDSTKVAFFDEDVVIPASRLTSQFLAGEPRPNPADISPTAASMLDVPEHASSGSFASQSCAACQITCTTQASWDAHLKSRKHKKLSGTRSVRRDHAEQRLPIDP